MFSSAIVLGTFIILPVLFSLSEGSDKCYLAKTCVHDGKEKCGKDDEGNVRRFIDSCDIKEYNCLKNTDYRKTSSKDCKSLPPIDEQDANDSKDAKDNVKQIGTESNEASDESKNTVTEAENETNNAKITESNESAAQKSESEMKVPETQDTDGD